MVPNDGRIQLKSARDNMDLSQEDVAKMLGVTAKTIGCWERYETFPDVQTFKKMCEIYHRKMDDIFLPTD